MKTYLPQNQFNSGAHVPVASGSAAVSLSPPSQTAADCIDETCENLKFVYECTDGTMFHRCTTCSRKAYLSAGDGIPEIFRGHYALNAIMTTGSDISDVPEVFRVANQLCAAARRFVPDETALWNAMHDPNAPLALETDPVWADDAPLFLKAIGGA